MASLSLNDLILCTLCLCVFLSFSWAARSHFIDPGERSFGMRLILAMSLMGVLVTLATYIYMGITAFQLLTGLFLYVASLMLFWWSIASTRAAHRLTFAFAKDAPNFLVMTGPYRFIRHPFYTSYLLFWLSGALVTGAWWLAVLLGIMAILYWTAARAEERKFASSGLSDEYRTYTTRTGMFLPWAF